MIVATHARGPSLLFTFKQIFDSSFLDFRLCSIVIPRNFTLLLSQTIS